MSALDDKLKELGLRFVARAPDHSAAIGEAVAAGNREVVIEEAHRLAGIAGMFGFPEIGATALALESAARSGRDYRAEATILTDLLNQL